MLAKQPELIEPGVVLLQQYFQAGGQGTIDLLLMDSGRRIVVAELKKNSDDYAPIQLMRYTDYVARNMPLMAQLFSSHRIDVESLPRPILIAGEIPDDTRTLSCYLDPKPELFTYQLFDVGAGRRELHLTGVRVPDRPSGPPELPTIERLRNYVTEEPLRKRFDEIREAITTIDSGIDARPTSTYLGFYVRNHLVAELYVSRKSLWLGAYGWDAIGGRNARDSSIEFPSETESYDAVLDTIRKSANALEAR